MADEYARAAEEPEAMAASAAGAAAAEGGSCAEASRREDEIPGMSEANRRFPPPARKEAEHALRELGWGEQFVASQVVGAKGSIDRYLYSLDSAAVLLLGGNQAYGRGGDTFTLLDVDGFIAWVRDAVGDAPLAAALEEGCPGSEPYNDRLKALQMILGLRMVQYGAVREATGHGAGAGTGAGEPEQGEGGEAS